MEVTILPVGIKYNSIGLEHYCYNVAISALNQIHNDLVETLIEADKRPDESIIINLCMDTFTRAIWRNLYELRRYSPKITFRVYRLGNELPILACRTEEGMDVMISDRASARQMLDNANEVHTLFPEDKSIEVNYWDSKASAFFEPMLARAECVYNITDNFDEFENVKETMVDLSPKATHRVVCSVESMMTREF